MKLIISEEKEWFGNNYICPYCGDDDIWAWFNYCPTCGKNIKEIEIEGEEE